MRDYRQFQSTNIIMLNESRMLSRAAGSRIGQAVHPGRAPTTEALEPLGRPRGRASATAADRGSSNPGGGTGGPNARHRLPRRDPGRPDLLHHRRTGAPAAPVGRGPGTSAGAEPIHGAKPAAQQAFAAWQFTIRTGAGVHDRPGGGAQESRVDRPLDGGARAEVRGRGVEWVTPPSAAPRSRISSWYTRPGPGQPTPSGPSRRPFTQILPFDSGDLGAREGVSQAPWPPATRHAGGP